MTILEFLRNKFPQDHVSAELLHKYFGNVGLTDIDGMTDVKLEEIMLAMLDEYMNFTLDPDQLSVLCGKLSIIVGNISTVKDSHIALFIEDAADLDYTLRKSPEHAGEELRNIIEMYDKLKTKLS